MENDDLFRLISENPTFGLVNRPIPPKKVEDYLTKLKKSGYIWSGGRYVQGPI